MWGTITKRALAAAVVVTAVLTLLPLRPAGASVPVLVLDGTGWGHGVGLSQWGAEYLARTGLSTPEILGTFYPGANLSQAGGPIRVAVHQNGTAATTVSFPQGGEVRSPLEGPQAPGFPVPVAPGGQVRILFDGAHYRVDQIVTGQTAGRATAYGAQPCLLEILCPPTTAPPTTEAPTTTTTVPPETAPPTTAAPGGGQPGGDPGAPPAPGQPPASAASAGPVWTVPAAGGVTRVDERGRAYRGVIEATGGGALRLVNLVGVEDYLRGMSEVPGSWPAPAVQAQTIAARTYALRSMQSGGEMCDDARCQVYVGQTAESAGQNAAVAATAGQVVTYGGSLAAAVYSADAGGVSATTLEGFGTPDGVYPYLTTVRYETDNPLPWRLEVGLSDVGARLGYPGTVTGTRVGSAGPSGRAMEMVLEGSAGDVAVDGRKFARALGLRSTRFTAEVSSADSAPAAPPAAEEEIQGLPEEAAEMAAKPARTPHVYFGHTAQPVSAPALPDLPPALDPRRNLAVALAATLAAALVGAHVPVLLQPRSTAQRP